MIIKITPKGLIFFQIYFSLLYKILELFGFGVEKLNYVLHFVAIYLLFFMVCDKDNRIRKYIKYESIVTFILLITTVIGIFIVPLCYTDVLCYATVGMYVKGILNFYRYFIFFFAVIKYLDFNDVKHIFNSLEKIFVLNILLCFVEFFVMGCEQDFLGGIFGITYGGNVGLNILLCFFSALYALRYLNKKISVMSFGIMEVLCVLMATMAELKVYYIELIVIMLIASVLVKPNRNTAKMIIASVVILGVGMVALSIIFPKQLEILINGDKLAKYAGGSYVTGSLGRMTMFQQLEEIFFKDYPFVRLFGFGIGTFDATSTSYWAKEYSYLRVGWFGNSSILLNLGYVGLVMMYLFYMNLARKAFVWRSRFIGGKIYLDFVIIMIVIILASMFYNNTVLSGTIAYLLNFVIAIPIILYKQNTEK